MKRAFDFLFSLLGLILLSPFMLLIGLLIKLNDGGSVFFAQTRVGQGGLDFKMWKFRTMIPDAESKGRSLTVGEDVRITRVGRILRGGKIDEWPQLLNVLKGEMSFVGPRPEVRKYVDQYSDSQRKVLQLKPGITDMASFAFYEESTLLGQAKDPERFYVERLVPEKIRLNLEYAEKATVFLDFILVVVTVLRSLGLNIPLYSWMRISPPKVEAEA